MPPKLSHSLSAQLLPLIIGMSLLCVLVSTVYLYRGTHDNYANMTNQWVSVAAQSIGHFLQASQNLELKRNIDALALNPLIRRVLVTRGNPAVISYASQRNLRETPLNNILDSTLQDLAQKALLTQRPQHTNAEFDSRLIHTYILPMRITMQTLPYSYQEGLIIIQTDLTSIDHTGHVNFALSVLLNLLLIAGLSFGIYGLLERRVLKRLQHMLKIIRAREDGNLSARIDPGLLDELGMLGNHLNRLMERENEAHQKLTLYALEVKTQNLALAKARDEAQKTTQLKSDFLATMSHELRTPLHGIIGFSELLLAEETTPAEQAESIRAIHQSAQILLSILNDLLDLSKIESGRISLEQTPFNLRDTLADTLQLMSPSADEKNLALTLHYHAPENIVGDPLRLRQIFLNLLSNAIKFTASGSVTISIAAQAQPNESLTDFTFKITDTGIGIPADKLEYIFDKFTQAEEHTARKFGGTGLGLAICRKLIQMMNGHIAVQSQMGIGSTFTITVPFALTQPPVEKLSAEQASIQQQITAQLGYVRALVVDDNATNVLLARRLLEKLGISHIAVAQNGLEALAYLKDKPASLVFMDCEMPEMDGYEATRSWRKYESENHLPHLPIIAMTANATSRSKLQCLNCGMDDYISKPFSGQTLRQAVIRNLGPSRPTASPIPVSFNP